MPSRVKRKSGAWSRPRTRPACASSARIRKGSPISAPARLQASRPCSWIWIAPKDTSRCSARAARCRRCRSDFCASAASASATPMPPAMTRTFPSASLRSPLPSVALKSGRSEAGRQAAQSHTGALANEDRVVDAFFEHHGIWRAPDMRGLVEATGLYLKGWKPGGRRLVAISNSGAVCVLTADAAPPVGMPIATLAPENAKKLKGILPSFATTTNPIDLTAALLSNGRLFGDILPVIAEDPAADAFLIGVPVAGPGYDVEAFARDSAAFGKQTGKPLVIAATQRGVADQFASEGLSVFPTVTEAVTALHQFLAHRELMARTLARKSARTTKSEAEISSAATI